MPRILSLLLISAFLAPAQVGRGGIGGTGSQPGSPSWRRFLVAKVANGAANCSNATVGAATITGMGLDDATSGGAYTGSGDATYVVTISAAGTPDQFTWTKNAGNPVGPVAITGSAQTLSDGITITFAATTGHAETDLWTITVTDLGCWRVNSGVPVDAEADTSQDVVLFTKPARGRIEGLVAKTSTACAGATTINAGAGVASNGVLYLASTYDLKAAVSATNFTSGIAAALISGGTTFAAENVTARIATTVENVTDIDTGCAVDIWVQVATLP